MVYGLDTGPVPLALILRRRFFARDAHPNVEIRRKSLRLDSAADLLIGQWLESLPH
jgi:hypothetical protein